MRFCIPYRVSQAGRLNAKLASASIGRPFAWRRKYVPQNGLFPALLFDLETLIESFVCKCYSELGIPF
jgi:hypothetical protein